jgi:hypothetical protein
VDTQGSAKRHDIQLQLIRVLISKRQRAAFDVDAQAPMLSRSTSLGWQRANALPANTAARLDKPSELWITGRTGHLRKKGAIRGVQV